MTTLPNNYDIDLRTDTSFMAPVSKVLWFDDGQEGSSVVAPAHWPAAEILDECIALCDYDTPENATYHVTFAISDASWHAESESWDVSYSLADKTVAYHPDEPSCAPDCDHEWSEVGPYGEGAGTYYVAGCVKCCWRREQYHNCYQHGANQFESGVVYKDMS